MVQEAYDWEGTEWDFPGDEIGGYGRPRHNSGSALEEFVDSTLEELLYGYGVEEENLLAFIGQFVRRVAEWEVYSPKEILSEVVDGILEGRDASSSVAEPARRTATEE